ncbi:hypothetical protein CFBP6626_07620 [Agrobacterium tumefaciens]|nr:hypothetical protein CFBP6626_07620 [Agrobacterium tumefaciens]CUX07731.1 hypothetical protein AGR5A_Cc10038 [Agrobacterium genomosp. 5 str. CFBP 6626]
MAHPAIYSTISFLGMILMRVDSGTIITDEVTDQEFTVEDDTFVAKGNVIFCTHKFYDRLKEQIQ